MTMLPWGPWPPLPGLDLPIPPIPPGPCNCPGQGMPQFIWRPGGEASSTVLTTWAQVAAAVTATDGACEILVDPSIGPCEVPPDADLDCKGKTVWSAYVTERDVLQPNNADVDFGDGARLRNPAALVRLTFSGITTQHEFILADQPLSVFNVYQSTIESQDGSTVAPVSQTASTWTLVFNQSNFKTTDQDELVQCANETQTCFVVLNATDSGLGPAYTAECFYGGTDSTLTIAGDASAPFVPQTQYDGTVVNAAFDNSLGNLSIDLQTGIGVLASLPLAPELTAVFGGMNPGGLGLFTRAAPSSATPNDGGLVFTLVGAGGNSSDVSTNGGSGGQCIFVTGPGGTAQNGQGGSSGRFLVDCSAGGNSINGNGGDGGGIELIAGKGGNSDSATGGNPGGFQARGGIGGDSDVLPSQGGAALIYGGTGGNSPLASVNGAIGGEVIIQGGNGGAGLTSGPGGTVLILGGNSLGANGTSGDVVIDAGVGTGTNGQIRIGTSSARTIESGSGTTLHTHEGARVEPETALTDSTPAGTFVYDTELGESVSLTLAVDSTLEFQNVHAGDFGFIRVIHADNNLDITAYTITGGEVRFPQGTPPALSNNTGAIDMLQWYTDGTNVYVHLIGKDYKP